MLKQIFLLIFSIIFFVGCGSDKKVRVVSELEKGIVEVDGEKLGEIRVGYTTIYLSGGEQEIIVKKETSDGEWVYVSSKTIDIESDEITIVDLPKAIKKPTQNRIERLKKEEEAKLAFVKKLGLSKIPKKDVFIDVSNNLIWADELETRKVHDNYVAAAEFCHNSTLAGIKGWRLPTFDEIKTIANKNRPNNMIEQLKHHEGGRGGTAWTQTPSKRKGIYSDVYTMRFWSGADKDSRSYASSGIYARCVKSGDLELEEKYLANFDKKLFGEAIVMIRKLKDSEINKSLWKMHESKKYSKYYKEYLKKLEKSNYIGYLDTVAQVYNDNGNNEKAINIYKERILPKTNKKEFLGYYKKLLESKRNGNLIKARAFFKEKNYKKAFELYLPYVKKGNYEAMYRVSELYDFGRGVETNKKEAYLLYKKLVESNYKNYYPYYRLSRMLLNSELDFIKVDVQKAKELAFKSLSFTENKESKKQVQKLQASIDNLLKTENEQKKTLPQLTNEEIFALSNKALKLKKYDEVFKLMLPLANKGEPLAIERIANAYYFGDGINKDREEAIKWYKKVVSTNKASYYPYYRLAIANAKGIHGLNKNIKNAKVFAQNALDKTISNQQEKAESQVRRLMSDIDKGVFNAK